MSNFDAAAARRARDAANNDDDFETLADGTKVLRDGRTARHRMSAMDSASTDTTVPWFLADGSINPALGTAQQAMVRRVLAEQGKAAIAAHHAGPHRREFTTADAEKFGLRSGIAMHRPGHRFSTDQFARDSAIIALKDYDTALEDAWKTPPGYKTEAVTGQGVAAAPPRGARVGDVPASAPQRLDPTKDVQRPDLTKDVATIQKEHSAHMQALYNQIDQQISEAYKAR